MCLKSTAGNPNTAIPPMSFMNPVNRIQGHQMSVILDLTIFPMDQGVSVSRFVAPVIAMIRDSGHDYRLSAMGTQIETETRPEALDFINQAQTLLDGFGCERIYVVAKFDIRQGPLGRLSGKIESIRERIGDLNETGEFS